MDQDKQKQMLELFSEYRSEHNVDFETKRNTDNLDLFRDILYHAYPDTTLVVAGHHIMYMRQGHQTPYEIASADTLIFDHEIARIIWEDSWKEVLQELSVLPPQERDKRIRQLFYED